MAEPSLKILILFILLSSCLLFLNSTCTSHYGKIVLFALSNLLSWRELSCALLSVAWLSRKKKCLQSQSEAAALSHWLSLCLCLSLTRDTEWLWDLHGHLSIRFPAVIATYTLLLSLVSLAFLCYVPGFCAFCSFVMGFFCNSGLQFVVRAPRCSACHSGLSTVHICYVVACDGSVSALPSSASVLILELWNLFQFYIC